MNGSTHRAKEYSWNFATVSTQKEIGVLCNFYTWNNDGILNGLEDGQTNHCYENIKMYRATLLNPTYLNNTISMESGLLNNVEEFVKVNSKKNLQSTYK